jgi:hypothetical protein
MGRLWTYQEGFLLPWVDLELSDSCYDLYELIQRLYEIYYNHPSNPFPFVFIEIFRLLSKRQDIWAVITIAAPNLAKSTINSMC